MPERDVHALRALALARLAEATRAANASPDVESALRHLTAGTQEVLGDKEALSVQADSELGSASSLTRASSSSPPTVTLISWSPSTGFRLSNTACAFPSTLVTQDRWCGTSVPWFS